MKKYFLVKPSSFWYYDLVDEEGKYPHITALDFDTDEDLNNLMFSVPCRTLKNGTIVPCGKAKEIMTGKKFNVKLFVNSDMDIVVRIGSDKLGFYSDRLLLKDILCTPSKISGILSNMKLDKGLLKDYVTYVEDLFIESEELKEEHDDTVNGPSKSFISQARIYN